MSGRVRVLRKETATNQHAARPSLLTARQARHELAADVESTLHTDSQALDVGSRAVFEARFGHDFSQVRVHTDAAAAKSAAALGATAYTVGRDIVFGAGNYTPATAEGRALLAHELTHVVQHDRQIGDSHTAGELSVSEQSDGAEQEAERLGRQAAVGSVVEVQAAPGAEVAREEADEEKQQLLFESILKTPDLAWQFSKMTMKDMPEGIGVGFESGTDIVERLSKGEGWGSALGGGLVSAVAGAGTNDELSSGWKEMVEKGPKWLSEENGLKGASDVMGLLGAGMKLFGSAQESQLSPEEREKHRAELGTASDWGDFLDLGSKIAVPNKFAEEGVKEGLTGLYNTAQNLGDLLATGSDKKLLDQGESQLKGEAGPILQGYSMLANMAGGAWTGDWSDFMSIGSRAAKGELGALPKLGSAMGDWEYDQWEALKANPAAWTSGKLDTLSKVVTGPAGWASMAGDWASQKAGGWLDEKLTGWLAGDKDKK